MGTTEQIATVVMDHVIRVIDTVRIFESQNPGLVMLLSSLLISCLLFYGYVLDRLLIADDQDDKLAELHKRVCGHVPNMNDWVAPSKQKILDREAAKLKKTKKKAKPREIVFKPVTANSSVRIADMAPHGDPRKFEIFFEMRRTQREEMAKLLVAE